MTRETMATDKKIGTSELIMKLLSVWAYRDLKPVFIHNSDLLMTDGERTHAVLMSSVASRAWGLTWESGSDVQIPGKGESDEMTGKKRLLSLSFLFSSASSVSRSLSPRGVGEQARSQVFIMTSWHPDNKQGNEGSGPGGFEPAICHALWMSERERARLNFCCCCPFLSPGESSMWKHGMLRLLM